MSANCGNGNDETEFHESNCMECEEVDDLKMVQCDECDQWAHFRCVGVGPEIEDSSWNCRLCNTTISGLSLTETEQVDASVATVAEPPSFGTDAPTNLVGSSIATGAQALVLSFVDKDARTNYDGSSVATEVRALIHSSVATDAPNNIVGSSITTEAQALNLNVIQAPPSDDVATEVRALIHSPVGTDASNNIVGSSITTEAQASNLNVIKAPPTDDSCLKLVKEDKDLPVAHNQLEDKKTFEFYQTKLEQFGGSDANETVREIGQRLIADEVLMKYSYLGRREKLRFKDFDNLTKLVVTSTIASMKRRYFEVHGKAMVQSDEESKKLYSDVEKYFTSEYIRKAQIRFIRSLK